MARTSIRMTLANEMAENHDIDLENLATVDLKKIEGVHVLDCVADGWSDERFYFFAGHEIVKTVDSCGKTWWRARASRHQLMLAKTLGRKAFFQREFRTLKEAVREISR